MKIITVFLTILLLQIASSSGFAGIYYGDVGEPKANEVHIGQVGIRKYRDTIPISKQALGVTH